MVLSILDDLGSYGGVPAVGSTPAGDATPPGGATRPIDLESLTLMPRDHPILVEMSGANAGRVHALQGGIVTLGRGAQCTLCFPDATLSRVHGRLVRTSEGTLFEDLGSLNGSFINHHKVERRALEPGDRMRLGSGVRLQFQLVTADEEQVLARVYDSAVRDGLTGVFNRRHLDQTLGAEVAYAARHGTELCVMILDIDHFKRVNDTHGHLAGDEVIRQMAAVLREELRSEDLIARYGGEEFVVVARSIPLGAALGVADRLRRAVAAIEARFESTILRVTVSLGVAALSGCGPEQTPARLLARADEALYLAKASGRDRVCFSPRADQPPEAW
jgi:two-component system cell cycle response regulator